jgi:DNA-binding Lrp family transcriptional regulator
MQKATDSSESKVKIPAAFILLKVNENADFFKIYEKLHSLDNVLICDATRGDIDIFLVVQDESIEKCKEFFDNNIKALEDIKGAEYLPLIIPAMNDNMKNVISSAGISLPDQTPDSKSSVFSYVLAEVEKEKIADIYEVLKLTDNVVYYDFTSGKYNIIMKIHGDHFIQIDKFIENKLINLEGILKIKEYPIINIYDI